MPWREHIQEYINLPVIKTLSQHATGGLFPMFCFWISGSAAAWLFPTGIAHDIAEGIEQIGIVVVLLYLLVEMIWHLFLKKLWNAWKSRKGKSNGSSRIILVA
jgi:hypothetical protein